MCSTLSFDNYIHHVIMANRSLRTKYNETRACCFVPGCSSHRSLRNAQLPTDDRRHFFSFPAASGHLAQRNAWVLFCSRKDGHGDLLQPFTQPICDLYFQAEDIIKVSQDSKKSKAKNSLNKWRLADDAIPLLKGPVEAVPGKIVLGRSEKKSSIILSPELVLPSVVQYRVRIMILQFRILLQTVRVQFRVSTVLSSKLQQIYS